MGGLQSRLKSGGDRDVAEFDLNKHAFILDAIRGADGNSSIKSEMNIDTNE